MIETAKQILLSSKNKRTDFIIKILSIDIKFNDNRIKRLRIEKISAKIVQVDWCSVGHEAFCN